MSADRSFTAAMVQMRTGLLPEPSLEQGIKLIRQAAAQGADYVLTPEVSNMMQLNRKALFEHLADEADDLSLKAYRALAAELKIHLHVGSLALRASSERAVNRSFLIGPDGQRDRELRQDPHVRHRSAGRRKLPRIRQLSAWRDRCDCRPALGTHRAYDLLRRSFPRALSRARRKRRCRSSPCRPPLPGKPARPIGIRSCAPAPSRTAASSSPQPKPACTRTSARPSGIR